MRKRTGNDIWKNLYDFPCIETENAADITSVLDQCENQKMFGGFPYIVKQVSGKYIHILSHRRLLAKFIRIEIRGVPDQTEDLIEIRKDRIAELPIPRLIDRYLATLL